MVEFRFWFLIRFWHVDHHKLSLYRRRGRKGISGTCWLQSVMADLHSLDPELTASQPICCADGTVIWGGFWGSCLQAGLPVSVDRKWALSWTWGLEVLFREARSSSLCVYTFLVFHMFSGSRQVVTDAACGFLGGNDRAYLPWDRQTGSLALRFHYLLSTYKRCMTYLSWSSTPNISPTARWGAGRRGIPVWLCKQW